VTAFPTGSAALDSILGGGVPAAATLLIAGMPGTGKTILAQQILFANASDQRRALYLTTLSEPLDKAVRYAQEFSFFDADRLPGAIHYQDIGQRIRDEGIVALAPLL
jgi:circadian clock protein KaiC